MRGGRTLLNNKLTFLVWYLLPQLSQANVRNSNSIMHHTSFYIQDESFTIFFQPKKWDILAEFLSLYVASATKKTHHKLRNHAIKFLQKLCNRLLHSLVLYVSWILCCKYNDIHSQDRYMYHCGMDLKSIHRYLKNKHKLR